MENRGSHAQLLLNLVNAHSPELFNSGGEAHIKIAINQHFEVLAIRSKKMRMLLVAMFFAAENRPPSTQGLQDAIDLLEANALFDSPTNEIYVRRAFCNGRLYLDLANEDWDVIEIDDHGWRICSDPPVRFKRPSGLEALPTPLRGGNIWHLFNVINIDHDQQILLLAFLLACFAPSGPYPLLILTAEHGSGKTTKTRLIKDLVDPNRAPLRGAPRNEGDLIIAALNSAVLAYDNLSYISPDMSDALCRMSTGGGFAKRQLYTDLDEVIVTAMRPVILTGINDLATRSDLLDRALILQLPRIDERSRKTESEINECFQAMRPFILGCLLDAVSTGLANLASTRLPSPPRLADFATWVTACEASLGVKPGTFLAAYNDNRAGANQTALADSPVFTVLEKLLDDEPNWTGSFAELFKTLDSLATEAQRNHRNWPRAANTLSNKLRQIAPNLRQAGVELNTSRNHHGSRISLKRIVRSPLSSDHGDDDADYDDVLPTYSDSITEPQTPKSKEVLG